MSRIAFIACSKTKKRYPAPARELYQGSLFKKALRYTESEFNQVYILSAKYGLVSLDKVISPYEKTLNNMSVKERKKWAEIVLEQMEEEGLDDPSSHYFFTGSNYCEYFEGHKPLEGLSLGFQLQWFQGKLNEKYRML